MKFTLRKFATLALVALIAPVALSTAHAGKLEKAQAYVKRGDVYYEKGNLYRSKSDRVKAAASYDKAIANYDKAILLAPSYSSAVKKRNNAIYRKNLLTKRVSSSAAKPKATPAPAAAEKSEPATAPAQNSDTLKLLE